MTDTAPKTNGHNPPEIHELLDHSVETIAQGLIDQLKALRQNTVTLENQLLACVTQTRDSIARLHTIGDQVAEEARRGRELCEKLAEGINQITGAQA